MSETCNYLFVYGTLLLSGHPGADYLKANGSVYGGGKFAGKMFDIGEYPGALFDPQASGFVHGTIFKMDNPATVLKALDDYEGFGDDQPQPNLYVRRRLTIKTGNEEITCEVYLYNLPVDELMVIESGDYLNR